MGCQRLQLKLWGRELKLKVATLVMLLVESQSCGPVTACEPGQSDPCYTLPLLSSCTASAIQANLAAASLMIDCAPARH